MNRSSRVRVGGVFARIHIHILPSFYHSMSLFLFFCLQFSHLDSGSYVGTIMYSCGVFAGQKGDVCVPVLN